MRDLVGKVAMVTGAGQNIGLAIATSFAERGAQVVGTWATPSGKDRLSGHQAGFVERFGAGLDSLHLDLRDLDAAGRAVEEVTERHGRLDIVVHNAGLRPRRKIAEVTVAEWEDVVRINLAGPFFVDQAAIPLMRACGWGRIVHVGGLDAYWGNPQRPHVVASKLGLVGLVRSLANEVARWGITVNTVVPGTIDTVRDHPEWYPELGDRFAERMVRIPMARLGGSEEVAAACAFLCSNEASYITAQELFVSGGAFPLVRQPDREY